MHWAVHALVIGAVACLAAPIAAQAVIPNNGGSGIHGRFDPQSNTTLDTRIQNIYELHSLSIRAGVVVNVIGPEPLVFRVTGAVRIDGTLLGNGSPGAPGGNDLFGGLGGAGGPGGGRGGDAGCQPAAPFRGDGETGGGRRPGTGGLDLFTGGLGDSGGGGGGANASAGASAPPINQPSPGLEGRGGAAGLCRAGAGGGGGACDVDSLFLSAINDGGGGGGGGGGRITIASNIAISIGPSGIVRCDGGEGGTSMGHGGSGGGGSGGSIELAAPRIELGGALSTVGGRGGAIGQAGITSPGGAGGDGCVFAMGALTIAGSCTPPPIVKRHGVLLTTASGGGRVDIAPMKPGDSIFVALSTALSPSKPATGVGTLYLDPTTPLFAATFGQTSFGSFVTGLSGAPGPRIVRFDISLAAALPDLEAEVYLQALFVQPAQLSGLSDLGVIYFKF